MTWNILASSILFDYILMSNESLMCSFTWKKNDLVWFLHKGLNYENFLNWFKTGSFAHLCKKRWLQMCLEWFCKERNWRTYVKIIVEYFEVKWLCKMIRRTKYDLLILRTNFAGKSCGKQGVKAWTVGCGHTENCCLFTSKLVLFGQLKN